MAKAEEVKTKLQEHMDLLRSESMKSQYQSALFLFIRHIYGIKKPVKMTVEQRVKENAHLEQLIDQYLADPSRNCIKDILSYKNAISSRPALSQRQTLNIILAFLTEYHEHCHLTERDTKKIRRSFEVGNVAIEEADFDVDVIRKMLRYSDVKFSALLYTLISSGMRIGETLSLRDKDIDFTSNPVKIKVPAKKTKTKRGRTTFISTQAAEALKAWLATREDYLKASNSKNKGLVKAGLSKEREANGDHLFPFSDNTARQMWESSVAAAGLLQKDEITKRYTIHIHMTRKFFVSQASLDIKRDVVEHMAGHKGINGEMNDSYRRYTDAQLAEFYLKAEPRLTIADESGIKTLEQGFKVQLQKNESAVASIAVENAELKNKLAAMEERIVAFERILAHIQIDRVIEQDRKMNEIMELLGKENVDKAIAELQRKAKK